MIITCLPAVRLPSSPSFVSVRPERVDDLIVFCVRACVAVSVAQRTIGRISIPTAPCGWAGRPQPLAAQPRLVSVRHLASLHHHCVVRTRGVIRAVVLGDCMRTCVGVVCLQ